MVFQGRDQVPRLVSAELRRVAVRFRRSIRQEMGLPFLIQVADQLFAGEVLEEKIFAVLLLEKLIKDFGDHEFRLFESWNPTGHELGGS